MACSLVLVDDLLVRDTIDDRYGFLQNQRCCSFVATSIDCLAGSFDRCTQGRTLTGVVQVLLNCLTSTLTCLCGICHLYFLKRGRECLRGKPDRGAEFCKATDYNQFLRNRQIPLASKAILSQESTHGGMCVPREIHSGNISGRSLSQLLSHNSDRHPAENDQKNNNFDSRESCGGRSAPAIMPLHELA
jgi:hypothetical protein